MFWRSSTKRIRELERELDEERARRVKAEADYRTLVLLLTTRAGRHRAEKEEGG